MGYPKRPKFHAMQLQKEMLLSGAAQTMGANAALLVSVVACMEDRKDYKTPPDFHTSQLLNLLGLRKWEALDRAREAAVKHGWLHYEAPPNGSRQPGIYWTTYPVESPDHHPDHIRQTDKVEAEPYPPNGDGQAQPCPRPSPVPYPSNGDGGGYSPSHTHSQDQKDQTDGRAYVRATDRERELFEYMQTIMGAAIDQAFLDAARHAIANERVFEAVAEILEELEQDKQRPPWKKRGLFLIKYRSCLAVIEETTPKEVAS